MRRILSLLILITMLAGVGPTPAMALSETQGVYPSGYTRANTSQYGLLIVEPDDPDNPQGFYLYILMEPAIAGITSPLLTVRTSTTGEATVTLVDGQTANVHLVPEGNWLVSQERIHFYGDPALLGGLSSFGQWYVPISSDRFWAWEGYYCGNIAKLDANNNVIPEDKTLSLAFLDPHFIWVISYRYYAYSDDFRNFIFVPVPGEGQVLSFYFSYHGSSYYVIFKKSSVLWYKTNFSGYLHYRDEQGSHDLRFVADGHWHSFSVTYDNAWLAVNGGEYQIVPRGIPYYSAMALNTATGTFGLSYNALGYYIDPYNDNKNKLWQFLYPQIDANRNDLYYSSPLYVTPVIPLVERADQPVAIQGVSTYTIASDVGGDSGSGSNGSAGGTITGTTTSLICTILGQTKSMLDFLATPWQLLSSVFGQLKQYLSTGTEFISTSLSAIGEFPSVLATMLGFFLLILVIYAMINLVEIVILASERLANIVSKAPMIVVALVIAIAISGIAAALGAPINQTFSQCGFGVQVHTDGSTSGSTSGGGSGGGGGSSGW